MELLRLIELIDEYAKLEFNLEQKNYEYYGNTDEIPQEIRKLEGDCEEKLQKIRDAIDGLSDEEKDSLKQELELKISDLIKERDEKFSLTSYQDILLASYQLIFNYINRGKEKRIGSK